VRYHCATPRKDTLCPRLSRGCACFESGTAHLGRRHGGDSMPLTSTNVGDLTGYRLFFELSLRADQKSPQVRLGVSHRPEPGPGVGSARRRSYCSRVRRGGGALSHNAESRESTGDTKAQHPRKRSVDVRAASSKPNLIGWSLRAVSSPRIPVIATTLPRFRRGDKFPRTDVGAQVRSERAAPTLRPPSDEPLFDEPNSMTPTR
jgi:hypothetical protein